MKDPKPVIEPENNSEKSTTETEPSKLAKQTIHKDESTNPVEKTSIELPPMKQKCQQKIAQEYTELYASRQLTRNKKPIEKAAAQAIGTNKDHPTKEQSRNK
jgi:hypothetical protein